MSSQILPNANNIQAFALPLSVRAKVRSNIRKALVPFAFSCLHATRFVYVLRITYDWQYFAG